MWEGTQNIMHNLAVLEQLKKKVNLYLEDLKITS